MPKILELVFVAYSPEKNDITYVNYQKFTKKNNIWYYLVNENPFYLSCSNYFLKQTDCHQSAMPMYVCYIVSD